MRECKCGMPVRLRAMKVSVGRQRGVCNWIEHVDGSPPCGGKGWVCTSFKPYQSKAYEQMLDRWEQANDRGEHRGGEGMPRGCMTSRRRLKIAEREATIRDLSDTITTQGLKIAEQAKEIAALREAVREVERNIHTCRIGVGVADSDTCHLPMWDRLRDMPAYRRALEATSI